jgi:hypothetical protein
MSLDMIKARLTEFCAKCTSTLDFLQIGSELDLQ